jgi:leader peptidase (prepilin peptidase)/N-methyltransferase
MGHSRPPSRALLVVAALSMAGGAGAFVSDPVRLGVSAPLGALLLALAVVDARSHRLPNLLTALVGLGGVATAAAGGGLVGLTDAAIGAALGLLGAAVFAFGFRTATGRTGLGGGDVKLIGALGAWTGWALLPQVSLWACLAGLAATLALRLRGRPAPPRIAFGPWLVVGFWIVWTTADLGAPPV